jgi:hypothetical protein
MGARVQVSRARRHSPTGLPEELRVRCSRMAKEIREQNLIIRDDKVLGARMRICSGYYDSEHVLGVIASRLLSEPNLE